MYTETNSWGTIIGRPHGLTNGSMEDNEAMGGGISPPSKGSMALGSPSSLVPLVLTIFFCLILLDSYSIGKENSLSLIEWVSAILLSMVHHLSYLLY